VPAVVGVAVDPAGGGWDALNTGTIVPWGGAPYLGDAASDGLNAPIVGIASDPAGGGYWLVASDGGVFSFGNARFYGSEGGSHLNKPVVGIASDPSGGGYWLVASDGGVFSFGNGSFFGSLGSDRNAGAIVGIASAKGHNTYALGTSVGSVTTFSASGSTTTAPIAGLGGAAPAKAASVLTQLFSPASPFNQALANATPYSTSLVSQLAAAPTADIYQYGEPIYTVNASTPRYNVSCTENWGLCSLAQAPVPIPAGATPSPGTDGDMVIYDPIAHLSYEFWQASQVNGNWQASWGAVVSTTGVGNWDIYGNPGGTGSGISVLQGIATTAEMQAGNIPHALSFSSSLTCSSFVAPAIKSDGSGSLPNCLPEGSRIQLNPAIDLAAIPGITPFELTVGRALQTYGAFLKDTGGTSLALAFQEPPTSGADPYAALGASGDYYNMPHIPWSQLRIVSS